MTETGDLARRAARLQEQVRDLADPAPDDIPIMVMTTLDLGDPRIRPLVAAARAEGRHLVQPWSEDADGNLIDRASAAYRSPFADEDANPIQLGPPAPVTPRQ